jgi:hypothetical protein
MIKSSTGKSLQSSSVTYNAYCLLKWNHISEIFFDKKTQKGIELLKTHKFIETKWLMYLVSVNDQYQNLS